jgi:DNA helicase-2/ATP-dependent DNA helicase PcrA
MLIAELREEPRGVVANLLLHILERTRYLEYLTEFSGVDSTDRRDNVFELMAAVKEYDLSHPDGSLENFLQETSLVQDVDALDGEANQVMVMTMHSAKGLEFPIVIMPALEEGVLPHLRSIQENDIEEERRLCYVGITRAREELILSHARVRYRFGQPEAAVPSRFLRELPEDSPRHISLGYGSGTSTGAEDGGTSFVFEPDPDLDPEPLAVGDAVVHGTFGRGTITEVQGAGLRTRVKVRFENVGEKILLLEFARLRRA